MCMCVTKAIIFFTDTGGKRADASLAGKRLPPPIDTRNFRGVTGVWPGDNKGIKKVFFVDVKTFIHYFFAHRANEVAERNRKAYETELNLQKIDNINARAEIDAMRQFDEDFVSSL